ncbi:DNA topoisomerase 1 [uncultured virus]|nr:DNA topoisomerase 1 [uncultured virus]
MGKTLIIVESAGKIKKIESILGKNYFVMASYGHILDLEKRSKDLSVDINDNFRPIYKPLENKLEVISKIKKAAKTSSEVIIAADFDREGEQIAWCIAFILKLKNPKRITFTSINKKDITDAIKNPRTIDYNLVDAQKCRRILDRIVGYEVSPLLYQLGVGSLSAGRVQSVVTRLIVDKETEINVFFGNELKSFFKFKACFMEIKPNAKPFNTTMHNIEMITEIGIYKGNVSKIISEKKSRKLFDLFFKSKFWASSIFDKKSIRNPSPPFTTSTLQQEANKKLGFNGKRTMQAAQNLYEAGYITYMRTDSVNLSNEAIDNIQKFILENYGEKFYRKMLYKSKNKNTQEAHEAVRPTDVFTTQLEKKDKINHDELRLYSLIWKRSVASQMKPAEFNITTIQITIDNDLDHFFMTTIENLLFPGFMKIYNLNNLEDEENKENENSNIIIPKLGSYLKVNLIEATEDYPRPPSRFNEASLVDKLDPKNLNIGRPATYSPIINKILEIGYIKIENNEGLNKDCLVIQWDGQSNVLKTEKKKILIGKEKNKFIPTDLGIQVNNFLVKNFSKIMDYEFTSLMEKKLDKIAQGKIKYYDVLKDFYDEFHPLVLKNKNKNIIENESTKILGKDPNTGNDIIATIAAYGPVVKTKNSENTFKYAPIKKPFTLENITLEEALNLFKFPKFLGKYENNAVILNKGKFGLYITVGNKKYPVEKEDITLNEVINLIDEKKTLFELKTETKLYTVNSGPYGKYIKISELKKNGKVFTVKLPENIQESELDEAKLQEIIQNNYNEIKNKYKKDKNINTEKIIGKKSIKKLKKKKN